MVFSSMVFLFAFLPIVWIANRFLNNKISNYFLCIASLVFYSWGELVYVFLMIASVAFNYVVARIMGRSSPKGKKAALIVSIALNLGILAVFKYAGFLVSTINGLFNASIPVPQIPLPIGISFFTFQAMSYVIDVYRNVNAPQKNFVKLLLYISFFPQLIAGPIVKYHDIALQINNRKITSEHTAEGIRRFIVGLSKKVLISNVLAVAVDSIFAMDPAVLDLPCAWIGAVAFTLQLYFDFSGYSDMAIGLARMFGFSLKENFNYPFISTSIRDFWRRWHISLSTWFKEYVYIPLGGNRKGPIRTCLNRVAVFFLTGLWHGAQWTFVVWGLIHGAFMLLESSPLQKFSSKVPRFIKHIYALLVVVCAFVLFRADTFPQALAFLSNMFAASNPIGTAALAQLTPLFLTAFCFAIVGSVPWLKRVELRVGHVHAIQVASYGVCFVLLALCILSLASATHNPFIYFRF